MASYTLKQNADKVKSVLDIPEPDAWILENILKNIRGLKEKIVIEQVPNRAWNIKPWLVSHEWWANKENKDWTHMQKL